MWKVVVIAVLSALCHINALDYHLCQKTPTEENCLKSFGGYPREQRFVYNWDKKECYDILWSLHCPSPSASNNFATESECINECGGWA